MDHLSKWIQYTAQTLQMNIIPAAKNPVYICPKCLNSSPSITLPRINH